MLPADRLNYSQEWAASAWKRLDLCIPVDLDKVRKSLKLFIRNKDLGHDTGYIMNSPKRWYVVVNSRHNIERRRFTISHEICEYLLVDYKNRTGRCMVEDSVNKERFCDKFAVHLLMPEEHVREMANSLYHSDRNDKTDVLASRFCVSAQAMRKRLYELKLLSYCKIY